MKMSPHSLMGTQRPHEASCQEAEILSGRLQRHCWGDDNRFSKRERVFELSIVSGDEVSATHGH